MESREAWQHRLGPKRAAFCENYVAGETGVRGNATESYMQAGYVIKRHNAGSKAAALMARDDVQAYIRELQLRSTKELYDRLQSWKELAIDAQQTLQMIAHGVYISQYDVMGKKHQETIVINSRDTAAAATVVLSAVKEILERAFPKKIHVGMDEEDRDFLERVIGRPLP